MIEKTTKERERCFSTERERKKKEKKQRFGKKVYKNIDMKRKRNKRNYDQRKKGELKLCSLEEKRI